MFHGECWGGWLPPNGPLSVCTGNFLHRASDKKILTISL